MGIAYSDQKTKWNQNSPSEMIKTNELGGRVRYAYGSFTAATQQSDIQMFNLPNNARIIEGTVSHAALGSSTTISVGHAAYNDSDGTAIVADVDEFKAAAASTGVVTVAIAATVALGRGSIVSADKDGYPVTVSLAGGNGTGLIELAMTYVVD